MWVRLDSRARKACFIAAGLIFAAVYLSGASRAYLASKAAARMDRAGLLSASQLEPQNAHYHHMVGRYFLLADQDGRGAVAELRLAGSLNPNNAQTWLDLADAYRMTGDASASSQAIAAALRAQPQNPAVWGGAANRYLVTGEVDAAMAQFRRAIAYDPGSAADAVLLCWRTTHDASRILEQALPHSPEVYFPLLDLLTTEEDKDGAHQVWAQLMKLDQPFKPSLAFPYFNFLIKQHDPEAALSLWHDLAGHHLLPEDYLQAAGAVNGGFEHDFIGGGFDWSYESLPHVVVRLDNDNPHSGQRSLLVRFDGQSDVATAGIHQLISVQANQRYELRAFYRTAQLVTASGPRLSLRDPFLNRTVFLGEELVDTNAWREQRATFTTPAETKLLVLEIVRQPSNSLIRGSVWVDDLRLQELPSGQ